MSRSASHSSILVTGGFGFIGSHLVELLLDLDPGVRVHVVDDLSTSPIDLSLYIRRLRGRSRLTYDLCTVMDYFNRPSLPRYDQIFHLANVVGPVAILQHGGNIVRRTVEDTYAVADYTCTTGARLCHVSTSEVYGGGRGGSCSERDCRVVHPEASVRQEYSVAKLACEVLLMNLAAAQKLHAVIIRPFNVAGPRQSPAGGFVLPRFIRQALAGDDITVYGNGQMIRAFTHVTDVADGIVRALRRGRSGQAYNIGNPANRTTILHLAQELIRLSGSASRIAFVDPKTLWGPLFAEAPDKYPDASLAMSELDWQPRFGLEATIRDTLASLAPQVAVTRQLQRRGCGNISAASLKAKQQIRDAASA